MANEKAEKKRKEREEKIEKGEIVLKDDHQSSGAVSAHDDDYDAKEQNSGAKNPHE